MRQMPSRWRRRFAVGCGLLAWDLLPSPGASAEGPSYAPLQPPVAIQEIPQTGGPSPQVVLPSPQSAPGEQPGGGSCMSNVAVGVNVPISSLKQLVRMSGPELDQLYRQSSAGAIPTGKVTGRVIMYPGTKMAAPASRVARMMWQGKIFHEDGTTAVNKFFGVRIIKGKLYYGESWMDGRPSLILDYRDTSLLYAPYRDEIREVAPGLFLGLMYSRTTPQPTFKMYFALEAAR